MTGIVVRFNTKRGYGYVQPLIGNPDCAEVFFHVSAISRRTDGFLPTLPIGCEVTFDLCRGEHDKPQCANVRLIRKSGSILQSPCRDKLLDSTSAAGPLDPQHPALTPRHGPPDPRHPPTSAHSLRADSPQRTSTGDRKL